MKKITKAILLAFLVLISIAMLFSSCNDGSTHNFQDGTFQTPNENSAIGNDNPNHSHVYGEWVAVKGATCTDEGVKERSCACGAKEIQKELAKGHEWEDATCTKKAVCKICKKENGKPLGHTTDRGICDRCGEESYSPYQAELEELESYYEEQKKELEMMEYQIMAEEDLFYSLLNNLGVSSVSNPSYYSNQINIIQSKVRDKRTQMIYAEMAGDYLEANALSQEVSQLEDQLSTYYELLDLAEQKEEIQQLKNEYNMISNEIEREYQKKLRELQEKYK